MLTNRYLASAKNLPAIMEQIKRGTAPETFSYDHLKSLGFTSSNDRGVVPLLKDLGFLSDSGAPTARYRAYRDESRSKAIMGEALSEAYSDLFHVNARPTEKDREGIKGKFKATHNVTDRVAELQAATFFSLLKLADLDAVRTGTSSVVPPKEPSPTKDDSPSDKRSPATMNLRYNIEVHLPATKEIEVYNAIFKSLREHLGD